MGGVCEGVGVEGEGGVDGGGVATTCVLPEGTLFKSETQDTNPDVGTCMCMCHCMCVVCLFMCMFLCVVVCVCACVCVCVCVYVD